MKKLPLNNNLKAAHKSDNEILKETQEVAKDEKGSKNEWIKKQFAQDGLIYQRIKCPVTAMVCCLIHQV